MVYLEDLEYQEALEVLVDQAGQPLKKALIV